MGKAAGVHKDEAVLVTGGTGFIASHLARKLVKQGYRVILLDARPNWHRIADFSDKVEVVRGDLGVWGDVVEAIKEYHVSDVFHAAARLSIEAERRLGAAYSSNVEGTFNLLEACRLMGVRRVVFLSSLAVFGANTPFPFHEKSYRDPWSFYGVSKAFGEMLGMYYHYRHGMDFRCARFAVVIGPGRRGAGATVTFSTLVEKMVLNHSAIVDVPEGTLLPILYVDDAVDFLLSLWRAEGLRQRIFIAGGVLISIQDLIAEVKRHVPDAQVKFEVDPEAERVSQSWTLLTMMLVQKGQEKLYREIKEIGWKLKYDTVQDIVAHFVKEVLSHREIYSAF